MCVSAQSVRDVSVTGEFDAITDAKIALIVDAVCPLYKSIRQADKADWRMLVRLHAAAYLHDALQNEGGEGGGGPVSSESFAQVGSRSYAVAALAPDGGNWWASSPYGRLWHRYWIKMPPALRAV